MKITRKQLRQIIKEEISLLSEVWTSFEDARSKSLEPEMQDKKVYYFDPDDDFVHTLVNGVVAGRSEKAPHGSKAYKNYSSLAKKNPNAFFNFGISDDEVVTESYDTNSDGDLDPSELRRIASELEGDRPLVKRGGRHERIPGYSYYDVAGVHVRNDYNPRADYSGKLDKVLAQMRIRY